MDEDLTSESVRIKLENDEHSPYNHSYLFSKWSIFTKDKQYAFIDITTYKKDNETEDLNSAYFGTTLLIYQNQKGKGWIRIKKRDYLIL